MPDIEIVNPHPEPLPCPVCDEKQNAFGGHFDPDEEPFGPFRCIVCGHQFSRQEYHVAVAKSAGREPRPG